MTAELVAVLVSVSVLAFVVMCLFTWAVCGDYKRNKTDRHRRNDTRAPDVVTATVVVELSTSESVPIADKPVDAPLLPTPDPNPRTLTV